jgi:hypothetical protein
LSLALQTGPLKTAVLDGKASRKYVPFGVSTQRCEPDEY